jgi:hypothetical protein
MSAVEDALRPISAWAHTGLRVGAGAPYRLPVYIACTLLALLCNYQLGMDVGWDTLDYHLYAGFSAVHDRFAQDYFAAGPQSYFNPYIYAPYYLLVTSGLSALSVSSVLAIAHSTVLWLTYELANCVCPSAAPGVRLTTGLCAVALASLNPILLQQIGSSYADITTAALVLCGWWLLARALHGSRASLIVGAGLILGAATAFKLTNAVHAVAAVALLLMLPEPLRCKARRGLQYACAVAIGFTVVAAPWAWHLEQQFGNPFFPLLNNVFGSPDFTTEPLRHFRFLPSGIAEALWRPFAIAIPDPMVQTEALAPDLRYAVLLVLGGVLAVSWLWRHRRFPSAQQPAANAAADTRALVALACGLGVDWVLWLFASGNGRYFLPMACVAAVLIAALLFRGSPKWRNYSLAAIIGAQCFQVASGTEFHVNPLPWNGPWLRVVMPEPLSTTPELYLTLGVQTNSFIAAYLPPGSGLVNFSGEYPLAAYGSNGARVAALIRRYSPRVRVLRSAEGPYRGTDGDAALLSQTDDALERFGLRVDTGDCATIAVPGVPPPLEPQVGSAPRLRSLDTTYLVSCRVISDDPSDRARRLARQRAADLVLDRLEDACPQLFQPRRVQTVHVGGRWQRKYMNTDLLAWVGRGQVSFVDLDRADGMIGLGAANDWTQAPLKLVCGRTGDHYFARLLPSNAGAQRP